MLSKPLMLLRRASHSLGLRALFMTLLALISVIFASLFDPFISPAIKARIDQDAILPILTILASSMLAVTTFSLGVMVQAFQSASSQATPRAYRILMQDSTTQNVLATFVGAFLFSLTAIVLFRADFYDAAGTVVVFALTLFVIAGIILAILRWISHLSQLGSMDHILAMVERAAQGPLRAMSNHPALGGVPSLIADPPPFQALEVRARRSGYVQFVDMPRANDLLNQADAQLWLIAAPGRYVLQGDAIAYLDGGNAALSEKISSTFTIGKTRSLEQDSRFGVMVLSEIGTRALSPGVNDPGTAIDVIHRLMNVLHGCAQPQFGAPKFDRIVAPMVGAEDLIQDAFDVISRDGAGRLEVVTQINAALDRLAQSDWPEMAEAARLRRSYVTEQAEGAIQTPRDRAKLGL